MKNVINVYGSHHIARSHFQDLCRVLTEKEEVFTCSGSDLTIQTGESRYMFVTENMSDPHSKLRGLRAEVFFHHTTFTHQWLQLKTVIAPEEKS